MTTQDIPRPVPMELWGRDHWSAFGYIETRIVDWQGVPDRCHMRCDVDLHPQFEHAKYPDFGGSSKYPTRLKDGIELEAHDDWSCLDDVEAAGLLKNIGSGVNRIYQLTDQGRIVAGALRIHKAEGRSFGTFRWPRLNTAGVQTGRTQCESPNSRLSDA